MQRMNFESIIKNGYIKVPEKYFRLGSKKVMVQILDDNIADEERDEKSERVKNVNEFLQSCSGILKHTRIPSDITLKEIREMRLAEKYGI